MAQILRKKDTITVVDMKKEAEREARTMWQFVRSFLKWLVIAGVDRRTREEKAKAVLEQLGLSDKIGKMANELSGGQKQRVSIARALVHDPDIVLADEPTGNLDSQNGAEVMALLRQICDSGKSVVLVTHNMEDAKNADNVIFIKDGVAEMRGGLQ